MQKRFIIVIGFLIFLLVMYICKDFMIANVPDHDYSDGFEGKELGQIIYNLIQELGVQTSKRFELYKIMKIDFNDEYKQREQRLQAISEFLENAENIHSLLGAGLQIEK